MHEVLQRSNDRPQSLGREAESAKALAALYFFGYMIRRRAGFPARRPLRALPGAVVLNRGLGAGKYLNKMGFDRGRRGERGGRGRDKRDGFGEDSPGQERGGYGGGGGGDRFGGGGGGYGGGGGGLAAAAVAAAVWRRWRRLRRRRRRRWRLRRPGGGGGGGGGGMPPQVVGEGKGIVKFFNGQKGFGFIVRDDGGEDVFVHISAVEQAGLTGLAEGQPLEFTLVDRGGRVSATDLKIEGDPLPVEDRGAARRAPAAAAARSAS